MARRRNIEESIDYLSALIGFIGSCLGFMWAVQGVLRAILIVWAAVLTIAFVIGSRRYRKRIRAAEEDPSERLQHRIRRVNQAFTETATLTDELSRDLQAQQAAREALIAEAERQQKLLAINQADAERVREILVGETKATIRAERRQQWMFFALGVLASIPIGVAFNLLVP